MEQLMNIATKVADRVEIYSESEVTDGVSFENARLKDIESARESGVALLLIKDGMLGHAYTRNLTDREGLVRNALANLAGGVEADYEVPSTTDLPALDTYDRSVEDLTTTAMVDECERICGHYAGRTDGELEIRTGRSVTTVRVMNSSGSDLSARSSASYTYAALCYPGSRAGIRLMDTSKAFEPASQAALDFVLEAYNDSLTEVDVEPGRMRVLFLPTALFGFIWRIQAATSGKSIYEQVSPLKDKLGEQIFSDKLTILSQPLDDSRPGARAFDDEGTECLTAPVVEAGVLRGFHYDRYYAWKAKAAPTGHGFRRGITNRVSPSLRHLTFEPGSQSISDLLKTMDRGIVVAGAMGAHSGNILHGDYSIGLAPGLYVDHGEIVGRVKDAMVAGNIYETMQNVIGIGERLYPSFMGGHFPAVLFDDMSVTTKS